MLAYISRCAGIEDVLVTPPRCELFVPQGEACLKTTNSGFEPLKARTLLQSSSFFSSIKPRGTHIESEAISQNATVLERELAKVKLTGNRGLQTLEIVASVLLLLSIIVVSVSKLLRYMVAAPSKRIEIRTSMRWGQLARKLLKMRSEGSSQQTAGEPTQEQESDSENPVAKFAPIHVDIYGAAVSSLICDTNALALGLHHKRNSIRSFRVTVSFVGCWLHMGLQTYLLYATSAVISDTVVSDFRKVYDTFVLHMYGNVTNATYMSNHGFHRGNSAYFDPTRFATLDDNTQSTVCQMPLANDFFFLGIIFIWTLTCVVDVRKGFQMFHTFIVEMPNVPSVLNSVKRFERDNDEPEVVIVGVPPHYKAILVFFVLLPRLIVDCVTIWLGCKWLAATYEMSELLLNAVALEFVVLLNELILVALVPKHGLNGLERTKTVVGSSRLETAEAAVGATLMWVFLCTAWCLAYVYILQNVLPDYKWDIRDVCDVWLNFRAASTA